ncbi:hypothetical protein TSH7_10080 [Azospirillum sp. TSH7]|uniref:hypothetical protein n=1 Tax=unclassified Azospirillum TaxID=2630922 RepID=UPI000D6078B0|nr:MULTISPECIES: hypothetical protein [unclassified Azospirillum]PWC64014.1 hypothetical protein TSH20_19175 [Azospirillum sp. TSH20]PWC64877.1 hypothetical protein TSH7_10080 [Azospirillum sp. TSH7]
MTDIEKKLAQGMLGNLFSDETKKKAQEDRRGGGRDNYGDVFKRDNYGRGRWGDDPFDQPAPKAKGGAKTGTRKATGHRDATMDDPVHSLGTDEKALHTVVRFGKRGEPARIAEGDANRIVDQAVREIGLVLDRHGLVWTTDGNLTVRRALYLAIATGRAVQGPRMEELVVEGSAPEEAKPEEKAEEPTPKGKGKGKPKEEPAEEAGGQAGDEPGDVPSQE